MDFTSRLVQNYGLETVTLTGSAPELEEDETFEGSFGHVQVVAGDTQDLGEGELHVTTRRIIWVKQGGAQGLAASFFAISLHAIAQTDSGKSCIYMQLEREGSEFSDSEEENDEGQLSDLCKELRLIPLDANSVHNIFDLLSKCAALNPDGSDEDEEDAGFFYDGEQAMQAGNLDGSMLDHLDSLITVPQTDNIQQLLEEDPERFDDPDEEEEEQPNGLTNGHNH